jgi:hypothetical protein
MAGSSLNKTNSVAQPRQRWSRKSEVRQFGCHNYEKYKLYSILVLTFAIFGTEAADRTKDAPPEIN